MRLLAFCDRHAGAIAVVLCILIALVALSGCGESTPRPSPVTPPATAPPAGDIAGLEHQLAQAKAQVRDIEAALQEARQQAVASTLYWFIGIMALVAAIAVAVAIFVPAVARWAVRAAIAAAALACIAGFAVWLLPWLVWIGGALVAAGVLAVVVYWRLDAKSRDQVVRAVEAAKAQLPGYKAHFREFIDEDADVHLDAVRARLGLKRP
jgi:uncharacterized membrane protein YqgA involved in biofilm formation